MNWFALASEVLNRIPVERLLHRSPDNKKRLEELQEILSTATPERKAQPEPQQPHIEERIPDYELPTNEETAQALKRRLAKELYRAELDLANKLRISGKPCDCLESKHTLGIEAVAEELIPHEPDNPVYSEIIDWIKQNQSKVTINAIISGLYDDEYPRMAAEFRDFRKRIMGTTALHAMIEQS